MDGEYASTTRKVTPTRKCTVNNRIMVASDAGQDASEWGMVGKFGDRIEDCGILPRERISTVYTHRGERVGLGARCIARNQRRSHMAKFKIATPAGASFSAAGVGYKLEMEGLGSLDAEIVEILDGTEEEFARAARDADALYAKGRLITSV
jgi:hypothetical protein